MEEKKENALLVIDCASENREVLSFNNLQKIYDIPVQYTCPSIDGPAEMRSIEKPLGIIIFGSLSNVADNLPWHKDIVDYTLPKIKNNIPTLGICFGHQLITHAFGGKIGRVTTDSEAGHKGIREIQFHRRFFEIKKSEKLSQFVAHEYEIIKIPEDFVHLAQSTECLYDAVAHATLPYVGIQTHPEASEEFVQNSIAMDISDEEMIKTQAHSKKFMLSFLKLVKQHYSS